MRNALKILMALLIVGTLVPAAPRPAWADDVITVRVRSIAASTKGKSFDKKLRDLHGKLKKAFPGYTNFEQVGHRRMRLKKGKGKSMKLPNGSEMTISFHGMAGRFIKLGLSIAGKLNTTLRATPGSTFFQAGLDYEKGILILAITVQ